MKAGDWRDWFWAKVDAQDGAACWRWTAAMDLKGYGILTRHGRIKRAHRVSYEMCVGPIPDGLAIDHLCRVRRCVNPAHLEPVTQRENLRRGVSPAAEQARQTHCKNRHPLSDDNLVLCKLKKGHRECRTCTNAWQRARRAAKKGQP